MNLRLFTIALLASALPLTVSAGTSAISLDKGDFISAERLTRNGGVIVSVKLSKSGKAKLKKLNEHSADKAVHAEVAGVASDFKLREPIQGDGLEMGPYSQKDAQKVVTTINKR